MTVNIALVTSEAVIFGCDSIASSTDFLIDPFDLQPIKDDGGKSQTDSDGNLLVSLDFRKGRRIVTDVWGGVTKMFCVEDQLGIAAVTSGLAKLEGRTMQSLVEEYSSKLQLRKKKLVSVEAIAKAFLRYIRRHYLKHYQDSNRPKEFWDSVEFLVGGFGRDDHFPSLYRIQTKENRIQPCFASGSFGLAWGGQSNSVQRVIRGYDSELQRQIQSEINALIEKQRGSMTDALARILENILFKLEAPLPDDVNTDLPAKVTAKLSWEQAHLGIDYGNLPIQDAVDFVSWLVMLESGRNKFASGVPTVGGRTRIAIVRKGRYSEPEEPELEHKFRGFGHDL